MTKLLDYFYSFVTVILGIILYGMDKITHWEWLMLWGMVVLVGQVVEMEHSIQKER